MYTSYNVAATYDVGAKTAQLATTTAKLDDKFERFIPDSEITVWYQHPAGHQHDDTAPKPKHKTLTVREKLNMIVILVQCNQRFSIIERGQIH